MSYKYRTPRTHPNSYPAAYKPVNMVLKLYKFDGTPSVRAVLMTVDILGLKTETEDVNTFVGEQLKPEYLAKNPLHTVPLLEDGDFLLADSHAIITYLVSKYGTDKTYYPSDLMERATVDQRMYFEATKLFPKFQGILKSVLKSGQKGPSDQQIAEVETAYGYAERYLERSAFIAVDHITVADVSCVSTISTLGIFVPIGNEFPKLMQWMAKLEAQDWYKTGNVPGLNKMADLYNHAISK